MKKILSLLLALTLALSLAGCGAQTPNEITEPTEIIAEAPSGTELPQVTVDNPVAYFTMTLGETVEDIRCLTAYDNEDGTAYVEYVGAEKKVGNLDSRILHNLTAELEAAGLIGLDGRSEYNDGEAYGSMYISYDDGSFAAADFSGTIPQEFTDGYQTMEAWFQALTADMPVYVPQAQVFGEVNADALAAMLDILNASGMEGQDGLTISDIPMDEYFAFTAGLSTGEGIVNGTICAPMMNVTPYSLVIVTLENEGDAKAVRADFEKSLDWGKWVCVNPTNALIAQKGNMVLCLIGAGDMFGKTSRAIEASDWTEIVTFDNPNL